MKSFLLKKVKETNEPILDVEFTVSSVTVNFGRYDNESPPLLIFLKNN